MSVATESALTAARVRAGVRKDSEFSAIAYPSHSRTEEGNLGCIHVRAKALSERWSPGLIVILPRRVVRLLRIKSSSHLGDSEVVLIDEGDVDPPEEQTAEFRAAVARAKEIDEKYIEAKGKTACPRNEKAASET